jgi:nicotinamidase-related amidase
MVNTALLVMDVQNGVVERLAERSASLLAAIGKAIAAARGAGIPVIYVRVAFRPGSPEISARNRVFSAVASSARMGEDDPATQVHPAVDP